MLYLLKVNLRVYVQKRMTHSHNELNWYRKLEKDLRMGLSIEIVAESADDQDRETVS